MLDPLFSLQDRLSRLPIPERHSGAHIRDDLRSAIGAAGSDSVSCAIRARRVVEYVVRDVYQRRTGKPSGTQPLEGVLAKVVKDGHFPEELAGFVHAIKGLANRAAHDTNRSYPVEYLIPALDQTLLVLEWYFENERPSGQGGVTTVVSPVASPTSPPTPDATAPTSAAPLAPTQPEPGRKALVQLAVHGKKFSMSCTLALGLLVATFAGSWFAASWMLSRFRIAEEQAAEERALLMLSMEKERKFQEELKEKARMEAHMKRLLKLNEEFADILEPTESPIMLPTESPFIISSAMRAIRYRKDVPERVLEFHFKRAVEDFVGEFIMEKAPRGSRRPDREPRPSAPSGSPPR